MVDAGTIATFKRRLNRYTERKGLKGYGPNANGWVGLKGLFPYCMPPCLLIYSHSNSAVTNFETISLVPRLMSYSTLTSLYSHLADSLCSLWLWGIQNWSWNIHYKIRMYSVKPKLLIIQWLSWIAKTENNNRRTKAIRPFAPAPPFNMIIPDHLKSVPHSCFFPIFL